MHEDDTSDFQIQRANAHSLPAEALEQLCSVGFPRQNGPIGKDFNLPLQFGVGGNLAMRIMITVYFREPSAHLLLQGDDACSRVALPLGEMVCIKNEQSLFRKFAAADTRVPAERLPRSLDRP